MSFEVHVVVTLTKPPTDALMKELDHHFGEATHAQGTNTVELSEHVTIGVEADAIGFVRALVLEVVPKGAVISEITATPA